MGYRDHSLPHHRFEVKDFLLREDSTEMHSFVSAIRDIGYSDVAEDVAGGLEVHITVSHMPHVQQLKAELCMSTSSVCYQTCRRPIGEEYADLLPERHCSAYAEHLSKASA